jgi:CRISPR-associated protein Cmr1
MAELKLTLKTLTPLWTGGVDKTCDRLHETGIIGSLRWWYEAIVRGLGGEACDPTSEEKRCTYDPKKGWSSVCHACQIFGCTGLSRGFRVALERFQPVPLSFITMLAGQQRGRRMPNNRWWLKKTFESPGYPINKVKALFTTPQGGVITLTPRRPFPKGVDWQAQMQYLLWWIVEKGGLGPKIQNGFGQIQVKINPNIIKQGEENLQKFMQQPARKVKDKWPSISEFFQLEFTIARQDKYLKQLLSQGVWIGRNDPNLSPSRFVPCAFDIRYATLADNRIIGLRWSLKQQNRKLATQLFGEVRGLRRVASRINVSHLIAKEDQYRLRVFGFVPPQHRNSVLKYIQDTIKGIFPTARKIP